MVSFICLFCSLSAVFGAAYILGEPVDELLYGEDGNVKGIRSKEEV
jgi:RAB protein geranylgeranyltransferase component A